MVLGQHFVIDYYGREYGITKGIIILLFRDYWATEIQRNKIIAKQNYDRMKLEEKKKEKYNPDDIFKKKEKNFNECPRK